MRRYFGLHAPGPSAAPDMMRILGLFDSDTALSPAEITDIDWTGQWWMEDCVEACNGDEDYEFGEKYKESDTGLGDEDDIGEGDEEAGVGEEDEGVRFWGGRWGRLRGGK
ncbi:hypothetical protein MMC21_007182 [Puttea exsequens]|nr:hypothetical protein [Puttea exsequens]